MNITALPIIGWLLSLLFSMSMSIPFWYLWTVCNLGEKYFYFLPNVYKEIGFWNCVGLFIVISILKSVLLPRFSISNSAGKSN